MTKHFFKTVWHYLRAFALIFLCLWLGHLLAAQIHAFLPIPDSIAGMVILFSLLSLRIIPDQWVAKGCDFLLYYMILLFVPVSAGIVDHLGALRADFWAIVIACTVSTLAVFLFTAFAARHFYGAKNGENS